MTFLKAVLLGAPVLGLFVLLAPKFMFIAVIIVMSICISSIVGLIILQMSGRY